MPKLPKAELELRATRLKNLYIKHNGNKSRIAKELGITPQAITKRFDSVVGQKAQESLQDQVNQTAKKLGINLTWYLKLLKQGAIEPKKIIGYLNQYKKGNSGVEKAMPDEVVSNEFIDTPDWAVRHKYIVTIGEVLKYIKSQATEGGNKLQVFIGDNFGKFIKGIESNQARSDVKPE